MKYSQNNEEPVLLEYFGNKPGTFLDIGSNDGFTLSNTLALAERGWSGLCVEPSPDAFYKLCQRHKGNHKIHCLNYAISDFDGKTKFHHSGSHFANGDVSLLSTMHDADRKKWEQSTLYTTIEVEAISFPSLMELSQYKKFDFISIDCEGEDWNILIQMDLHGLGCQALCIEHNGNAELKNQIKEFCEMYGLTLELLSNAENIIMAQS